MNCHKRIVSILLIALVQIFALSPAWAGTSASISVSGNEGAITVSASASFLVDTHCYSQGNCWPQSYGVVSIYQDNDNGYLGGLSGNGSATFTTIVDGGNLSQGSHTFKAVAYDHEGGLASNSQTIIIDNTPMATVNSPGQPSSTFDITGTVTFKERAYGPEGTLYLYIDGGYYGGKQYEGTSINWKYSDFVSGVMLDAGGFSQGIHNVKVVAYAFNGATQVAETTFTIAPPEVTVNSPGQVDGAFDITGSVIFRGRDDRLEGTLHLYIDGGYYGGKQYKGGSINWKYSDFVSGVMLDAGRFSQGTHNVKVVASGLGGATQVAETTFTIAPPEVTVNSPGQVDGAFDITGSVIFRGRDDRLEGTLHLYIDGGYYGGKQYKGGASNWKYSEIIGSMLDAKTFTLGVHTIKVVAYASNGATHEAQGTFEVRKCDIAINNFSGTGSTINVNGGETVTLSANITDSSGQGITWTMNVAGRGYSGTGKDVNVPWDGKVGGRPLSSGSYTASLHAETEDGKCKADATLPIRVDSDGGCSLKVVFGSTANIATGNLAHEQELFSTGGVGLNTAITLYYNSLDSHNGILGLGWSHTYDISLAAQGDGSVLIRKGNGESRLYRYVNGVYLAPPGDYSTLEKRSDGYILTHKDGIRYNFGLGGFLASIEDRNANIMRFTYDFDTLSSITDSVGRVTNFLYDINGKLVQITDPAGKSYGFVVAAETGTLSRIIMPDGGIWRYAYDADGFMTSRADASGYITTYTYDDQHRVKTATDPAGKTRSITYSIASGQQKTATVTEKDGSIWKFTFDSKYGNLLAKTDPTGNSISYTYDGNHNLLAKTEADGSATSYGYDTKGNMLWSVDPLGNKTSYTYNNAGQVTSITGSAVETTGFNYDGNGNLAKVTDAAGGTTKYSYNADGRIVNIINQAGQAITLAYDAQGNVIAVTDPVGAKTTLAYDAAGRVVAQSDASGQITRFAYDAGGNLVKVTDPYGKATLFGYDQNGNRTSLTDANGRTTRYVYDYAHRVVRITDAQGQTTSLTYAEAGCATCGAGQQAQPATVTDANGHTTWFQYDSLGRLAQEIDQLGARISYQYDAKGNVVSRTDGEGRTTGYGYDALGRLVAKVYPDRNQALFQYDAKGRMISASNQHIGYTMAYDTLGRLAAITDSNQRTIRYQYDALGNRVKMTTPEGKQVQYSYDEANRLVGMDSFLGRFDFGYDRLGRRTSLSQPNGVTTGYGYDAVGRLTSLLAQTRGRNGRGGLVNSFGYTHDAVGNRLSKSVSMGDHDHQDTRYDYAYDAVYQLIQSLPMESRGHRTREHEQEAERFSYDPVGNRLTGPERHDVYRYNEVNELVSSRRTGYQYDYNGNLTGKDDWTYVYDYENRLIKATKAGRGEIKTVSFKYDPFGRRIEKRVEEIEDGRVEAKTSTYVYDNEDIILEYRTGSDEDDGDRRDRDDRKSKQDRKPTATTSRFVHGPGIDAPLAMEQRGRTYFYHADGLGSIVSLTDQRGAVVQSYDYDSFGNMQRHGGEVKQPYGYTGREWDKELGLYYYRARYYDPVVGRFIGKDPIGLRGGINLFAYVGNQPVDWIDPFGLELTAAQQALIRAAIQDWSQSQVPYVYGGSSKEGADCSGSVSAIYKQSGVDIGKLSSKGFKASPLFSPVTGSPQVGDVGVYPGHVVIYGGDTGTQGRDVWSASHTGGPDFGPANSSWYGKPAWYRYK